MLKCVIDRSKSTFWKLYQVLPVKNSKANYWKNLKRIEGKNWTTLVNAFFIGDPPSFCSQLLFPLLQLSKDRRLHHVLKVDYIIKLI